MSIFQFNKLVSSGAATTTPLPPASLISLSTVSVVVTQLSAASRADRAMNFKQTLHVLWIYIYSRIFADMLYYRMSMNRQM